MDNKLKSLLTNLLKEENLLHATLSSPRQKNIPKKISLRLLKVKNKLAYQFSYYQAQKVIHKNVDVNECGKFLLDLLKDYKQALFCTDSEDYQVLLNRNNEATILRKKSKKEKLEVLEHNRPKNYILKEGQPIPFLVHLGVMSSAGKVFADKYDKFRQINRFLEMIADVLTQLPCDRKIKIVDFGCGKAYLTFALYYYLHIQNHLDVQMVGLDLKEDVVDFCQKIAQQLQFSQLHFQKGDIQTYSLEDSIDMMVCLHACDTATDYALEKAVRWNAKVILAVPCCQHELFKQIESPNLEPLLKHGILKERFSALITDAVRAQFLEMMGYKTQILEFIDMEHTPKNLLIRAVKIELNPEKKLKTEREYLDLKEKLHIFPKIEALLGHLTKT